MFELDVERSLPPDASPCPPGPPAGAPVGGPPGPRPLWAKVGPARNDSVASATTETSNRFFIFCLLKEMAGDQNTARLQRLDGATLLFHFRTLFAEIGCSARFGAAGSAS